MRKFFVLFLAASLVALMTAGVAQAKGKPATKPAKKTQPVTYVFSGEISSVDQTNGSVVVDVKEANKAAKSFVGQQVTFAVSGTTKISLDDAEASLSDLSAGQSVDVQAKAPKGATSFTAGVISAATPPAPYYFDADGDGIGAGDPTLYVPGTEPGGWVSQGTDNCADVSNPDQIDTDGNGIGDACETSPAI